MSFSYVYVLYIDFAFNHAELSTKNANSYLLIVILTLIELLHFCSLFS